MSPTNEKLYNDIVQVLKENDEFSKLPIDSGDESIQELLKNQFNRYECLFEKNISPLIQGHNIAFNGIQLHTLFDKISI